MTTPSQANTQFVRKNLEFLGNVFLLTAACISILLSSSKISQQYSKILNIVLYSMSIKEWISEGLMTLFFLLVAMDLKKEIKIGLLSDRSQIFLPLFAAVGGMIVPAAVFLLVNVANIEHYKACAIPCATDIAFALTAFALIAQPYVSRSVKLFLMALAIFDDIGAILIIALFYNKNIILSPLLITLLGFGICVASNKYKTHNIVFYLIGCITMWIGLKNSGIHATMSGVLTGLLMPVNVIKKFTIPVQKIVDFMILPLFALAACTIDTRMVDFTTIFKPVSLGIFLGLVVGKQVGVMIFTWLAVKLKISSLPDKTSWMDFYVVALLSGIGFTMSLFIGELSFSDKETLNLVKTGLTLGSITTLVLGMIAVQVGKKLKISKNKYI
ncbi:Na+/H+ antiporter NhaA [Candidatus Sneabacter namystus]|uniref:Na(+)/H(+) antiporter NhaA n=1 Tax=Candidatus Sneabacter namystus TaxID=2601646 RepID=A0A5C0UI11_9RICK|nr:Na+/H+ antiporter NhaA [Candidatus Sneabacter namystus]QEK39835.1 Na+/H+ antiporter NhaA [Candidatus Sneabacter namystus]